jgi:PAS domain S-box-containing protein
MIYRMSVPDGRYEYISPSCVRLTGYSPEEFYANPGILMILIHPDWHDYFRRQWSALLKGNVPPVYEFQIIDRTGNIRWINQRNVLVTGERGQPVAIEGIVTDITERRKTEEAFRESESRLRLITDNMIDQISQIDKNQIILFISPSVERLMGFKPADLIGHTVTDFIHPDDTDRVVRETRAAIDRHQHSVRLEYRYRHQNGEYRWFESESRILYNDAGEYNGAVFSSRDITERRVVEEQLRESRERFQKIFEDSPLGIAIVSPEFTFRMVNRQFCEMLKYREEEMLTKSFTDITHPDHIAADIAESRKIVTGEREVYKTEKMYIKKDSSILWASLTASPVKDEDGRVLYAIALIEDISERKKAEEALQAIQEKYTKAFLSVPDAITISELDSGRFVEVNEAATTLFGYSRDEMIGAGAIELGIWLKKEDRNMFINHLRSHGTVRGYEVRERRKSGEVYDALVNADMLTIGGRHYFISIIRDITEQKRAERTIAETTKKIGLLSSITRHDVANQVSILKGFAKIALMNKPDPVVAGLLAKIDAAGSAIARQIEFTKAYQELGMHAPGWHRIRDIIAQQKTEGISLTCTCDAEIYADSMIEKVFFNLVDNAARHGKRVTEINVSCERGIEGIIIVVEDNGTGVLSEEKERIFERGYGKNTGFGLFLVREILALTGITIRENGIPGTGARFEISVPAEACRSLPDYERPVI